MADKCFICGGDCGSEMRDKVYHESKRCLHRQINQLENQLSEAQLANERLRTVCAEWAEDVLLAAGSLKTDGPRKGWYRALAREAIEAGDYLSLVGTYERHPDGAGIIQWYRRKDYG